jgi:integrase
MDYRIDTKAGRARLKPRRNPYYMPLDIEGGFIGYRATAGTWIARLRMDGKQKLHSLGKFEDHREAIRAAKKWMRALLQGVDPSGTVHDACVDYLKALKEEKGDQAFREARARLQRTLIGRSPEEARAQRCRSVEVHSLSQKKLSQLRRADLTSWIDELLPPEVRGEALRKNKASINRDLAALLAVLNHAHRVQLIHNNSAWAGIRKFKNVTARGAAPYISIEERRRLVDACDGSLKDLLRGICVLGCRPIELARAVVKDFNPRGGTLMLRSFKGNNERVREVPLRPLRGAESLVKRLCRNKTPLAPIWTRDDGKKWGHSDWDHLVRTARTKAKLDQEITAYSLRVAWITDAINGGADLLTVARITGTSVGMIDQTYGKLIESAAAKSFKTIELL